MDVHAVSGLLGVEQRRERRARARAAGDLAHDLAAARPRGRRAASALGGRDRDLELVMRRTRRRSARARRPACASASITSRRKRLDLALCLAARSRRRWRARRSTQLELVLEARPAASARARLEQRATASRRNSRGQHSHGLPSSLDDVAQHQLEGRAGASALLLQRLDADVGVGVGQQPQVARRSERVARRRPGPAASARGWRAPSRPPAHRVAGRVCRRHRASAHDRAEVAADERDELVGAHARYRRGRAAVVPRRAPASPSAAAPARTDAASWAATDSDHAAGGHVAPLDRGREALLRLQVHAARAERGIGVGDEVQAARRAPARAPTTHAKWPTSQSGPRAVVGAVEQVAEQLPGAGRLPHRWRVARLASSVDRTLAARPASRTARRASPASTGPRTGSPRGAAWRALSSAATSARGGRARELAVVDPRQLEAVVAAARARRG